MEATKVTIEKRQARRTQVSLRGICIYATKNKEVSDALDVSIENMSKHGIGFRLMRRVEVNVNDILRVKFALECEHRVTVVEKDIMVKWTRMDFVGAEFVRPIDDYESEIDFYLSGVRLSIYDIN